MYRSKAHGNITKDKIFFLIHWLLEDMKGRSVAFLKSLSIHAVLCDFPDYNVFQRC